MAVGEEHAWVIHVVQQFQMPTPRKCPDPWFPAEEQFLERGYFLWTECHFHDADDHGCSGGSNGQVIRVRILWLAPVGRSRGSTVQAPSIVIGGLREIAAFPPPIGIGVHIIIISTFLTVANPHIPPEPHRLRVLRTAVQHHRPTLRRLCSPRSGAGRWRRRRPHVRLVEHRRRCHRAA